MPSRRISDRELMPVLVSLYPGFQPGVSCRIESVLGLELLGLLVVRCHVPLNERSGQAIPRLPFAALLLLGLFLPCSVWTDA